jgi:hypothetical protein
VFGAAGPVGRFHDQNRDGVRCVTSPASWASVATARGARCCASAGNICAVQLPGGWTCSFPLYAGEGGGDYAGCSREAPLATPQGIRTQTSSWHLIATAWYALVEANDGDQPHGGNPMRRLIITLTIVAGLFLPAVSVASRVATGSTRNAIDRAAAPQLPPGIPERCLFAQVTTKDGGNWASVGFNGPDHRSCARWVFNGVLIVRRTGERWEYVTDGSALIPCGQLGIPVAVRQDLHLPCRPQSTGVPQFRGCGDSSVLHVGIRAYDVSCATSRRILGAYLHRVEAGGGFQRVAGFPGWMCSTGDRLGTCSKGEIGAIGVPEIDFFYLEAPG